MARPILAVGVVLLALGLVPMPLAAQTPDPTPEIPPLLKTCSPCTGTANSATVSTKGLSVSVSWDYTVTAGLNDEFSIPEAREHTAEGKMRFWLTISPVTVDDRDMEVQMAPFWEDSLVTTVPAPTQSADSEDFTTHQIKVKIAEALRIIDRRGQGRIKLVSPSTYAFTILWKVRHIAGIMCGDVEDPNFDQPVTAYWNDTAEIEAQRGKKRTVVLTPD